MTSETVWLYDLQAQVMALIEELEEGRIIAAHEQAEDIIDFISERRLENGV